MFAFIPCFRFILQPITPEEVEKASKISPLAMSMVKPPDPEVNNNDSFQSTFLRKNVKKSL